jgi:hypothetical protein
VIVHRRVIDLLRENRFTGWETYPVIVVDREGRSHLDYYGLVITGRCGAVDLARSVVVLSKYPTGWYPHFLGRYFDESSWGGSDFLMELPDCRGKASAHVFVTEPVRLAFSGAKIENVDFRALSEISVDTSVYEIGSQYLLPSDFSLRVAAAYRDAGMPRPKKQ